jgi:hypothetical protein
MKVLSKDLYSTLRVALAPQLKARRFNRLKGSGLGWARNESSKVFCFWFQCDRYGWFDSLGSSFTLEFQLDDCPLAGSKQFSNRARFFELLDDSDRKLVWALNNMVLTSLPPIPLEHPALSLSPELKAAFFSAYQVSPAPYPADADVWLHYYTPLHVATWADFFRDRLATMEQAFINKLASA